VQDDDAGCCHPVVALPGAVPVVGGEVPSARIDLPRDTGIRPPSVGLAYTNHPESPLPYVRAAVLNGCRSVQRRRVIARRACLLHRAAQHHDTLASAESEVILSEDRRQVLTALARLPRRRREVLVLRYYLGLSEAEIAAVLGISPGTVKSTAARALAALARDLGEPS
jgi:RNA polymerase sigma factor (sigma-70 family)